MSKSITNAELDVIHHLPVLTKEQIEKSVCGNPLCPNCGRLNWQNDDAAFKKMFEEVLFSNLLGIHRVLVHDYVNLCLSDSNKVNKVRNGLLSGMDLQVKLRITTLHKEGPKDQGSKP
jgi:hypothetical protein